MWLLLFFSYLCCPSLRVVAENDDVVVAVLSYLCCPSLPVVAENDDVAAAVLFLFMLPIPACCC